MTKIKPAPHHHLAFRGDIDGLRAIAVTSVVLFHAGLWPFKSGFVGVDIFFVISGYLINGIILKSVAASQFSYLTFYARRARRILPALIFVILATLALGAALLSPDEYRQLGASAISAILAVSNIGFWRHQDYFAPDARLSPLLMTWSLGVEEQFYFIVPAFALFVTRKRPERAWHALLIITLTSFLFSLWSTVRFPPAAYYLLPARGWELSAGGLLAAWHGRTHLRRRPAALETSNLCAIAGLAMMSWAIFGLSENTPFPGWAALLPVGGALLLLHSGQSAINRTFLGSRPLRFVGLISYSWYLWHWPLMAFLRVVSVTDPPVWQLLLTAALAFLCALVSWRFIEQPFRRARLANGAALAAYGVILVAVLMAPLGVKMTHGMAFRAPLETRHVEAVLAAGRGDCLAPTGVSSPDLSHCRQMVSGRPTIALIGDSHASAVGPAIRAIAADRGMGVLIMSKSSCAPLLDAAPFNAGRPAEWSECIHFMHAALQTVVADPSVKTVYLAGDWAAFDENIYVSSADPSRRNSAEVLERGLTAMMAPLLAAHKKVVFLGDVPKFNFDVGRYMITQSIPLRADLAQRLGSGRLIIDQRAQGLALTPRSMVADAVIQRVLQQESGVAYINLYDRFCDHGSCLVRNGADPLFVDTGHLSGPGANWARGALSAK